MTATERDRIPVLQGEDDPPLADLVATMLECE
jgi:hypothetical protein